MQAWVEVRTCAIQPSTLSVSLFHSTVSRESSFTSQALRPGSTVHNCIIQEKKKMGKIKDVLNSITKDEKNLSRSDSKATVASKTPRRASKASSQVTAESVATSASTAGGDSIEPDSKRLSTPNTTPVEVVDRRASFVEPLNSAVIPDTESQKVAAPITHNVIKHEEIEEITRKKEHDRHFHYVQHHIQPVHDKEVLEEVHHTQEAPVTAIHENITATAEDAAAYESLGAQFKDEVIHVPVEKKVIDHGEKVLVREHRHVHHVVQPVIEKETHERHRIHTDRKSVV